MIDTQTTVAPDHQHTGGENLEVMREAHKYNSYLQTLIRKHSGGARLALDYGAGIGTFSSSLDVPNENVHCVEPDEASRKFLARAKHKPHETINEIEDEFVDYVFTLNVLEHIADDAEALRQIYRVLKPGGKLLIYVPAFMLLFTSMDTHVGHHRRYRLRGLQTLVCRSGFRLEKGIYTDALGFFATLAYKWFDDGSPKPLSPSAIAFYDRFLFPISRFLSVPLAKVLGKNLLIVASKPKAVS